MSKPSQSLNRCIELVNRTTDETRWAEDAAADAHKSGLLPRDKLAMVQRLRALANQTASALQSVKREVNQS